MGEKLKQRGLERVVFFIVLKYETVKQRISFIASRAKLTVLSKKITGFFKDVRISYDLKEILLNPTKWF